MALLTAGNVDALSILLERFTGAVNGPASAAPFVWMRGRSKIREIRPRRSSPLTCTREGLRRPPPVSGPRDISRACAICKLVRNPSFIPSSTPIESLRVVSSSKELIRRVSSSLYRWYMWMRSTADRGKFSNSRMHSCSTSLNPHFWANSKMEDHCSGVAWYTEYFLQDVS